MTLVEYAGTISPSPLTNWQKKIFELYEQAEKENQQLFVCFPSRAGRSMTLKIIEKWKIEKNKIV